MLPYFKKLPFALKEEFREKLLSFAHGKRLHYLNDGRHTFKKLSPDKQSAPHMFQFSNDNEIDVEILETLKPLLNQLKYKPIDIWGKSSVLFFYTPAGFAIPLHTDGTDCKTQDGRPATLSLQLLKESGKDPTIFYKEENSSPKAYCYYDPNIFYLLNTSKFHSSDELKYERYQFQISFDFDMSSDDIDYENFFDVTIDGPVYRP